MMQATECPYPASGPAKSPLESRRRTQSSQLVMCSIVAGAPEISRVPLKASADFTPSPVTRKFFSNSSVPRVPCTWHDVPDELERHVAYVVRNFFPPVPYSS